MPPFTVTQAQAVVPLLTKELATLLPSYQSLKNLWGETSLVLGKDVDDPEVRECCLNDERALRALEQIEISLAFFGELGVDCRSIESGVFEFPCLVWNRFVYLCWELGDEQIGFWREAQSEYTHRRPLIELAPQRIQDECEEVVN